jgi:hypothetical protein
MRSGRSLEPERSLTDSLALDVNPRIHGRDSDGSLSFHPDMDRETRARNAAYEKTARRPASKSGSRAASAVILKSLSVPSELHLPSVMLVDYWPARNQARLSLNERCSAMEFKCVSLSLMWNRRVGASNDLIAAPAIRSPDPQRTSQSGSDPTKNRTSALSRRAPKIDEAITKLIEPLTDACRGSRADFPELHDAPCRAQHSFPGG